ncbi:hypothetical protein GUITHDRAFT_135425 [Guillardia theta CCMP2712]|uniref:Uncharacterized protein n=1 Tax=Guillardia theta (strain CCMP2712) TaxID=905079 RepID=L1JQC1_GUITC|nr:hypothetical protein GUITHDRAFT_135425 [Guillardia theta CCMP2712]EKX50263.1 hypothetical protein GUITHDRAFT_135425 [Guillardia theta CCMP2712]|eukprot:XP_005837243.1 hypothetical protein GUITHDRAFT_135425 [Guillardia theta CCMP2712]
MTFAEDGDRARDMLEVVRKTMFDYVRAIDMVDFVRANDMVEMFADIQKLQSLNQQVGPYGPAIGNLNVGVPDWQPGFGPYDSYGLHPTQDGGKPLIVGSSTGMPMVLP